MRKLVVILSILLCSMYIVHCGPSDKPNCTTNGTCSENPTEQVTDGGTTTPDNVVSNPSALRWNKVKVNTQVNLNGIAQPSANMAWAVGDKGTILHSKDAGATWTKQTAKGISLSLHGVSFIDNKQGWIVGEEGIVLHTKDGGETWTKIANPVSETLRGVQFLNDKLGYAVGDGFSLLRTNDGGKLWSPTSFRLDLDLYGLYFTSEKNGYVIGGKGSIAATDDGALNVTTQATATDQPIHGIFFFDDEEGWAVGGNGQLLKKEKDTNWSRPSSGTDSGLRGVWFASKQRGWIIGMHGTILGTTDGGSKWVNEARMSFSNLRAITGHSATNALIVGDFGTILRLEEIKDECKDGDTQKCYTGPKSTEDVGRCKGGTQTCKDGIWSVCVGEVKPADTEICFNDADDNCNGKSEIEDKCPPCKENERRECYTGADKTDGVGTCSKGEQFCRNGKWDVCEDEVTPVDEDCNGKDDDCDGQVDNSTKNPPACDNTIGVCGSGKKTCSGGSWKACEAAQYGPDYQATEDKCDGKDNDCDGTIDEGCPCTNDGESRDCYGGPAGTDGKGLCIKGKQTCTSGKWTECTGEVVPATEICEDQKDNDCDGEVDEKAQYALDFNGSSAATVKPNSVLQPTDGITLEAWVKIEKLPTFRGAITILSLRERGGYAIDMTSGFRSKRINFNLWPKGGKEFLTVSANINDYIKTGQWHHIAGTYDGKIAQIWIDGKVAAGKELEGSIEYNRSNVPLVFGAEASEGGVDINRGQFFTGKIAQVRLSNKAVYNLGFTPDCVLKKTADTIGLWLLEEGSGTTLKDETGTHPGEWNPNRWLIAPRCPGFSTSGGCKPAATP